MGGIAEKNERSRNHRADSHRPERRSGSIIHQDGFTLIELLVVIAIVALLLGVLLPALSRVRNHAKVMICQGRLRQWGMVLAAYTEDHRGRLPSDPFGFDGVWLLRGAFLAGKEPNASQDSFHHFRTQGIACCPMATKPCTSGDKGTFRLSGTAGVKGGVIKSSFGSYSVFGTAGAAFVAWEITTPEPAFHGSYGLNQWLFKGFDTINVQNLYASRPGIDLDVLSLRGRGDIPVLLDAVGPLSAPIDVIGGGPLGPDGSANNMTMSNFTTNRHGGITNALFLDWSVRKVGLKELWTLRWYAEFNRSGYWTKADGVKPAKWPQWMRGLKDY